MLNELQRVNVEAVAGAALNMCCAYLSAERQNDAGTGTACPGCLQGHTRAHTHTHTHTMYDILLTAAMHIHMYSSHVHVHV